MYREIFESTRGLSFYLLSSIKTLTAEDEHNLTINYYENKDVSAAHKLAISHIPFVVRISIRYSQYFRVDLSDLVQAGLVGLMRAIKAFNPYKGCRLITFAIIWIKSEIKEFIRDSWSLVKIGTTDVQRKLFFKVRNANKHDEETNKEYINSLALESDITSEEVSDFAYRVNSPDCSLDATISFLSEYDNGVNFDIKLLDKLVDESQNPETAFLNCEEDAYKKNRITNALETLREKERFIIEKRYLEEEPWTLQKLGDYFKISKQRVNELEKRALSKLKTLLSEELLLNGGTYEN